MIRCWLEKIHVVKPKGAAATIPATHPRPHGQLHHYAVRRAHHAAKWKITCVATGLAIPSFAIPYFAGGGRLGDLFSSLPPSGMEQNIVSREQTVPQAVPEPSTIVLLLTFIFILAVLKKLLDNRRVHIHTSQR